MLKNGSLLIFLGVLSAMLPTLSGLYPLVLVAISLVGIWLTSELGGKACLSFCIFSIVAFAISLSGLLSVELFTVAFASSLLVYFFPHLISIALLLILMESPLFQTIALIMGSWLPLQLEQATPFLFLLFLSIFIFNKNILKFFLYLALILFSSLLNWFINLDVVAVGIVNAVIVSFYFASNKDLQAPYLRYKFYVVIVLLLIHSIFIWTSSTRIDLERIVVWIPPSVEKYESQFFKDYSSTLNLAGIKTKQISDISEIHENSLVIVPWGTAPGSHKFLLDLKNSPIGKSLTVLIGGEHTNYSGFADRLNPLFDGALRFNNTTTIPPNNANQMGALWTSSALQFPFNATINRGASLTISSLKAFPILIAKSIFADSGPNEFNDFWVGDFLLGHSDPRGWSLLMAAYKNGPLWVLSGDNSFLMNRYLLPNPTPVIHTIFLATLFPMLLLQLWILMTISIWVYQIRFRNATSTDSRYICTLPILVLSIMFLGLTSQSLPNYGAHKNLSQNLKYFGGDERSSAVAISAISKAIDESNKRLFVYEEYMTSKDIGISGLAEIHVGHIKNGFTYNGIKIDNCGISSYTNSVEPKINLLETQYCRVSGNAKIIVGDVNQASVIEINSTPPVTLILDKYFLSGSPPVDANIQYLLKLLE
jgi:hypothetical protein